MVRGFVLLFLFTSLVVRADDIVRDEIQAIEQTGQHVVLNEGNFLTRAKKRVQSFKLKDLVDIAPFAIVAKCYADSPNLTLGMLGVTLVIIASRNAYIDSQRVRCIRFCSKVIRSVKKIVLFKKTEFGRTTL